MADYKNNMVVKSSILPPPTKTLYYYPVKDVYIDQNNVISFEKFHYFKNNNLVYRYSSNPISCPLDTISQGTVVEYT